MQPIALNQLSSIHSPIVQLPRSCTGANPLKRRPQLTHALGTLATSIREYALQALNTHSADSARTMHALHMHLACADNMQAKCVLNAVTMRSWHLRQCCKSLVMCSDWTVRGCCLDLQNAGVYRSQWTCVHTICMSMGRTYGFISSCTCRFDACYRHAMRILCKAWTRQPHHAHLAFRQHSHSSATLTFST